MPIGLMVLLILLLALLPAALSLWQLYCLDRQMHRSRTLSRRRRFDRPRTVPGIRHKNSSIPEFRYVEGVGYLIGDLSCEFNARSPHIRCAVNPMGPCKGCRVYQARDLVEHKQGHA